MRFFRFLGRTGFRVAILVALIALFTVKGLLSIALGWTVCAYLLWRAWPRVRSDFRFIWSVGKARAPKGIARF